MGRQTHSILVSALMRILRKLVRVLLRNGVAYPAFAEYARRAYVQAAREDLQVEDRKPTVSRVAVVTGLNRKEVKRLVETPLEAMLDEQQRYNRAARVVTGWVRDAEYREAGGAPCALALDDPEHGFPALVRRYSGDMTARAVLDELVRGGAVRVDGGSPVLMQRGYIPKGDDGQMLHIFGTDVGDLIATIDHNLQHPEQTFFQQKVSYDNVPREALKQWRILASKRSQELLELLDRELSGSDRDINPQLTGTGRVRTGVGIFYFDEPLSESSNEGNQ